MQMSPQKVTGRTGAAWPRERGVGDDRDEVQGVVVGTGESPESAPHKVPDRTNFGAHSGAHFSPDSGAYFGAHSRPHLNPDGHSHSGAVSTV